jgi:glutathione synthase/RimK-type ligase-like ATP-grasp enzyme
MLHKHRKVIVKPLIGSEGKNVIKISKIKNNLFEIHSGPHRKVVKGKKRLNYYLRKRTKGRRQYIVQYCIPLAKANEKPMDFRYIVQRKGTKTKWVITGKYGKIARAGFFTTNLNKGARVVTVEEALQKSNIHLNVNKVITNFDRLTLNATKWLTTKFPNQTIWGFDLAVDKNGKIWIIEANSQPRVRGFCYLNDLSMDRTIKMYQAYNKNLGYRR